MSFFESFAKVLQFYIVVVAFQCHSHGDYFWRVTIQQKHHLFHIAEVHFFHKGSLLSPSKLHFTASSYMNAIDLGNAISGPPGAANDNNIHTFFHSAYDDGTGGGYNGTCCPDPTPTLIITTTHNISFDKITIINRQDLDDFGKTFFYRLVGATIMVHDRSNKVVLRRKVNSALSTYDFYLISDSWSPNMIDESCPRFVIADMGITSIVHIRYQIFFTFTVYTYQFFHHSLYGRRFDILYTCLS